MGHYVDDSGERLNPDEHPFPESFAQGQRHMDVLTAARQCAAEYGQAFAVFVGGFASNAFFDVGAARDKAREHAAKVGRDNVRIKRISV